MLLEFTVGNYRSFRDDVTISLVATSLPSQSTELEHGAMTRIDDDLSVLNTAAVYGANASGKSNLIQAIFFVSMFVRDSARKGQSGDVINVQPFRFDQDSADEPSYFEMVFRVGDVQYRYGFEVSEKTVHREWLFHRKRRETLLFKRTGSKFELKSAFGRADVVTKHTRDNALFLSVAAQLKIPLAKLLVDWFGDIRWISGLGEETVDHTVHCLRDKTFNGRVLQVLRAMDLGIDGFKFEERERTETQNQGLSSHGSSFVRGKKEWHIDAVHNVLDEDGVVCGSATLDLKSESQGTQKLFALAGPLVALLNRGGLMVIDEFDARLHPVLSRKIIEMFHDPDINTKGAQLLLATHDSNLLARGTFRRDQIWFVEKSKVGVSSLFSLASIKVPNDASYESDYIRGRYGAIPFLGGLKRVLGAVPPEEAEANGI